jgi:hypothetical protein
MSGLTTYATRRGDRCLNVLRYSAGCYTLRLQPLRLRTFFRPQPNHHLADAEFGRDVFVASRSRALNMIPAVHVLRCVASRRSFCTFPQPTRGGDPLVLKSEAQIRYGEPGTTSPAAGMPSLMRQRIRWCVTPSFASAARTASTFLDLVSPTTESRQYSTPNKD